jgi:transcriptional regulator with XRE-family HTH domain
MKHGNQKIIACKANCEPGHLCRILKGTASPSWSLAKRLAHVTHTDPADWMEGPERIQKALEAVKFEADAAWVA